MPVFKPDSFSVSVETKAFNDHIREFAQGANIEIDLILRKFALDLVRKIILRNPVDTGRSRAAWYVAMEGLGGRVPQISSGKAKGKKTDDLVKSVSDGYKKGQLNTHLGPTVTDKWIEIVNGVEYIIFLEYGHSRQAPHGMVRISMRELRGAEMPREMGARLRAKWNRFYSY